MWKKLIICLLLLLLGATLPAAEEITLQGKWHTIKWGETIAIIAQKYNVNPHLVAGVNNITDWNLIYAGFNLWIPLSQLEKARTYVVKKNDILLFIARKFNVPVWSIANANGIFNLNLIYPGQELIIPAE